MDRILAKYHVAMLLTFLFLPSALTSGLEQKEVSAELSNIASDTVGLLFQADGGFFIGRNHHDWDPLFAARCGIGLKFLGQNVTYLFLEYYKFELGTNHGNGAFRPREGEREDICGYASIVVLHVFELAIGANYTNSSKHYIVDPVTLSESQWKDSGIRGFKRFLMFGARYEWDLGGRLHVPVGIYYRTDDYGTSNSTPILLRIGLMLEL